MFQSSIPDRGAKPLSVDVGLSLRSAAIPLMHSIPPDFFRLQALVNNSNNTALVVSLTPPSASSSSCNTSIAAFPSSTQNHSEAASAGRARGPIRGFDINLPPSVEEEGSIPDGRWSQPLLKREREAAGEVSSRVSNEEEEEEEREGEEEEGEEGSARKKLRLSKEQSALLEESFRQHSTLNPKQKTALANQLGLKPRQVEVWFQNRRARTKLKQTEVDCELLRRCYGSLREENRRLQKELQELRALRGASACYVTRDYYTSPPAATLAMCPSCEKVAGINPPKQHRLLLPHQTMELEPPPPSPLYHQHQLRQSSAAR